MIKNQNYRIIQLGVGKYTKVYCMELETDMKVAVKVLKSEYEKNKFFQDQLIKEARLGMQISHPSVRKVLDIVHNDEDNTYQIMMEFLEGYNMQEYIQNFGGIPETQIIEWLKTILPALIESHRKGIVHGLLKPGNLILTPRGKLKICDFKGGYFESEIFPENVDADDILFLSPEQIQHIGPITPLSDIYTLGVTIYTLLSGRDPYDAKNADVDEIRLRILNEPLPYVDKASLKINSIIQAATAKNPKERFPLLDSMLEELDGGEFRKKDKIFEEDLFTNLAEVPKANDTNNASISQDLSAIDDLPKKVIDITSIPDPVASKENGQVNKSSKKEEIPATGGEIEKETTSNPLIDPEEETVKTPEISLEDRAQAVWDKLGIPKSNVEPTVNKIPVVQTTDFKKIKDSSKQAQRPDKKPEAVPAKEADKLSEQAIAKSEIIVPNVPETPKQPDVPVKPDVIKEPEVPKKPEIEPPKEIKEPEAPKETEIPKVPRTIHIVTQPGTPTQGIQTVRKEVTPEFDHGKAPKEKTRWFLPAIIGLGIIAGGYFIYDAYFVKNTAIVVENNKNDSIADTTTAVAVNTMISEVPENALDSIISGDSTMSLLELEQAKLDKIKELEVLKKKKEEAKEKELANSVDKTKIEILGPYIGNIAPYKYKNLIGFISKDGKIIKKPYYNEILNYNNGLAPVNINGKWGFVNTTGTEVIPAKYMEIFGFSKGLAGVKKDGKWGFINSTGGTVVPFNYDVVTDFADGLAGVRKNGKWGFVNKNGSEVITAQYDNAWSFKDGLAGVEKNNKWGFIDKSGATVIDLKYGQVNNFIEGYACVEKNGKYGFINKNGLEVINCEYEAAKPFKNGTARVFSQGKWIYINKLGKCVRDCN